MNKRWHDRHGMPSNATEAQRIKWHLKHQKACGCRSIPKDLQEVLKARSRPEPPKEPLK